MADISVRCNSQKRTLDAIKVLYQNNVRNLLEIKVKTGGVVRIIWQKVKAKLSGLFVQDHSVTIQEYTITFNFD